MTEDNENSFLGSQPEPWLRGVADPYESGVSAAWKRSMSFSTAATRLSGLVKGSFRGIEVLGRGVSPRIVAAEVLGSGGDTPVGGGELEARLGLDSTWAYFSVKSGGTLTREPDASGGLSLASPPAGTTPGAPTSTTPPASTSAGPQGGAQAPVAAVSTSRTGGAVAR